MINHKMVLYNISLEAASNIFKVENTGYDIQNERIHVKFIQDVEIYKAKCSSSN